LSSGGKIVAPRFETFATISAQSGQSALRPKCSLTEQSGQRPILVRTGNDVNDPERTKQTKYKMKMVATLGEPFWLPRIANELHFWQCL
jgi:hypothetical protein